MTSSTTSHKILVVGATGATGKHVVQMLLDRGDTEVVAIARSQDKLMGLLRDTGKEQSIENLTVKEAGVTKLTIGELQVLTEGCTAIVRYELQQPIQSRLGRYILYHGSPSSKSQFLTLFFFLILVASVTI